MPIKKSRGQQLDREIAAALRGPQQKRSHAQRKKGVTSYAVVADDDKERVIELLEQGDNDSRQVARDLLLQRDIIRTGRVKQLIPMGESFSGRIFMVEITGLARSSSPSGHRFWVVSPSFKVGDTIDFTTTREPPPTGRGTNTPKQQLHQAKIFDTPKLLARRWVDKWWIEFL